MEIRFDTVVIGGGLAGMTAAAMLQSAGQRVAVIASGRSLHTVDHESFIKAGGALFMGDIAIKAEVLDHKIVEVITSKLGASAPLCADNYILCTGKFFSMGLMSDMNRVWEPLLGCDVETGDLRFNDDFSQDQPFLTFGVKADAQGHPMVGGEALTNVQVCGEILAGISPADKESVSQITASAQRAAQNIIDNAGK